MLHLLSAGLLQRSALVFASAAGRQRGPTTFVFAAGLQRGPVFAFGAVKGNKPLLCISLLALLLLPLSLSCDTKRPPEEVSSDFMATVQTDLDNTRENITSTLQNSSCRELRHKPHSCMPNSTDFVTTLHKLTCKMKTLGSPTEGLVTSVLSSIRCPCPTKEPKERLKKRWMPIKQRRNETRKLCKVKEILSTMTKCYEMLNTIHGQTPNSSTL